MLIVRVVKGIKEIVVLAEDSLITFCTVLVTIELLVELFLILSVHHLILAGRLVELLNQGSKIDVLSTSLCFSAQALKFYNLVSVFFVLSLHYNVILLTY